MNLILTTSLILATCVICAVFSRASSYRRFHHFGESSGETEPQAQQAHHDQHSQHSQHGQATTEYALVLLGAGLIALILITWATTGGAEGRIGQLFDSVIDTITSRI
jgi:Flp pilus assembly pilin Flp